MVEYILGALRSACSAVAYKLFNDDIRKTHQFSLHAQTKRRNNQTKTDNKKNGNDSQETHLHFDFVRKYSSHTHWNSGKINTIAKKNTFWQSQSGKM